MEPTDNEDQLHSVLECLAFAKMYPGFHPEPQPLGYEEEFGIAFTTPLAKENKPTVAVSRDSNDR